MHVKITNAFDDKAWPANLALLIYVSTITLKQFKNLTLINMFSCLGGLVVTYLTAVRKVPISIPDYGNDYYVVLFFVLLCFYFFVSNVLFAMKMCDFFNNVNSFSIHVLDILQNFDRL